MPLVLSSLLREAPWSTIFVLALGKTLGLRWVSRTFLTLLTELWTGTFRADQ